MANRLTNLAVDWVSLVDRAAVRDPQNPTQPQRLLVWKAESSAGEDPTHEPQGGQMNPDELKAALTKAEQERDAALEAVTKTEGERDAATAQVTELEKAAEKPAEPTEPKVDPLAKADPEIRAMLAKAETEAAELRKAAQEATDLAKAEREIRVTREFIAKADEYRALPLDGTVFGPVLKAASEKFSKEENDELIRVLKAADEQIAKSDLFKEQGRSTDGNPESATATDALQKAAVEIRKSDSSLNSFQAMQRAMRENPDLAAAQVAASR
jgi:hypothetical protein